MKIRLSIKQKLQVYIISITAVFMIAAILYISKTVKETAINNAEKYTKEVVSRYSQQIEKKLNTDLTIVRTLSQTVQVYDQMTEDEWKILFPKIYSNVLIKNKQLDDIWDSWEYHKIRNNWEETYGRYCITAYNEINSIRVETEEKSLKGDSPQYAEIKSKNKENISEPYMFSFTGGDANLELITDLSVPVRNKNQEYIGLVGADIRLEKLQVIVNSIKPFQNSKAYLISNEGVFASHPNKKQIGKSVQKFFPEVRLFTLVKKGKDFTFSSVDSEGNEFYNIFHPITIGNSNTPWSLGVKVPLSSIVAEAKALSETYMIGGFVIIFIISLVIALIARMITNPLKKITKNLQAISEGEVNEEMFTSYNSGDEIENISKALNRLIKSLIGKALFAEKIGQNEYDAKLELLSENDTLGQSLVNMQLNLVESK